MLLPGVLLRTDVSHSAPVPRVTDLVVAGQKSGWLWALDAAHDGALAWAAFVCPGGSAGGLQVRVYPMGFLGFCFCLFFFSFCFVRLVVSCPCFGRPVWPCVMPHLPPC